MERSTVRIWSAGDHLSGACVRRVGRGDRIGDMRSVVVLGGGSRRDERRSSVGWRGYGCKCRSVSR